MQKYPDTDAYIFNPIFVELRVMLLARDYDLPYKRVRKIMMKTVIKEPIHAEMDLFNGEIDCIVRELKFQPSLPDALRFMIPVSAFFLFENKDTKEVAGFLDTAKHLFECQ